MGKRGNLFLIFVLGIIATAVALPLLYAMGLPSFDVVLTTLFGEGSSLAVILCVALIGTILFGVGRAVKVHN